MAAAKPEIAIFLRIIDINQCIFAFMLARNKISPATLRFLVRHVNGTSETTAEQNRKRKTRDGDHRNGISYMSASSILVSPNGKPVSENIDTAVGISLISGV